VQTAAVDDADASMSAMLAVLDEPSDAGERVGTCHAVQVSPAADGEFALFQFPDKSPIDAVRYEVVV
jgi:hypothetical protein